jgi:hypothetical protein
MQNITFSTYYKPIKQHRTPTIGSTRLAYTEPGEAELMKIVILLDDNLK